MPLRRIDLNSDLSEGFAHDEKILHIVTSANVACGAHAGSLGLMKTTISRCAELGVRLGVHPGYPDREAMGRAPATPELRAGYRESLLEQVSAFLGAASPAYLKPHGALYNGATRPSWEADLVAELLAMLPIRRLMGLPGTHHERIAQDCGAAFEPEGFGDRAYLPDGTLQPRSHPGAVILEEEAVVRQSLRLANHVESICLHGDSPGCAERARALRAALECAGFSVASP